MHTHIEMFNGGVDGSEHIFHTFGVNPMGLCQHVSINVKKNL